MAFFQKFKTSHSLLAEGPRFAITSKCGGLSSGLGGSIHERDSLKQSNANRRIAIGGIPNGFTHELVAPRSRCRLLRAGTATVFGIGKTEDRDLSQQGHNPKVKRLRITPPAQKSPRSRPSSEIQSPASTNRFPGGYFAGSDNGIPSRPSARLLLVGSSEPRIAIRNTRPMPTKNLDVRICDLACSNGEPNAYGYCAGRHLSSTGARRSLSG